MRRRRQFAAAKYWFVTDRCVDERFFLRPDGELHETVVEAIKTACERSGVALLGFVMMANHWHLALESGKDPRSIATFMQLLKAAVGAKVNEQRGRRGPFWSRRYSAQPILDEASLLERMFYILMNPVRAGVSATVQEYPGLSSVEANTGMRGACGAVELPFALPPQWRGLDATELAVQKAWFRNELKVRERAVRDERIAQGKPRPKPERCLALDPWERPKKSDWRPAPSCFAATKAARTAFAKLRAAFVEAYELASEAFRSGVLDVMFPAGAFPPRLLRPPIEAPAC